MKIGLSSCPIKGVLFTWKNIGHFVKKNIDHFFSPIEVVVFTWKNSEESLRDGSLEIKKVLLEASSSSILRLHFLNNFFY